MLRLNKEKENLLVDKYGFEKQYTIDKSVFYNYKKCLTIYSYNHKYSGIVQGYSLSKQCQDIVYDLIKDNVLIKDINEDRRLKEKKIETIKKNIDKLQKRLKDLEGN